MKQNGKKLVLAPSLISLDDCNMVGLTSSLEKCGFDTLHVDIIDGYFSPDMPIFPAKRKFLMPPGRWPN